MAQAPLSLCTCNVALAGDRNNVVRRGEGNPATWPEVEILMALHGNDAVSDIEVFGAVERTNPEEYERLALRYGGENILHLFPGAPRRPAMEREAPKHIPRVGEVAPKKRGPKPKSDQIDTAEDTIPAPSEAD